MNTLPEKQRRLFLKRISVLSIGIYSKLAIGKTLSHQNLLHEEIAGKMSSIFGGRQALCNLGRAYLKQTNSYQKAMFFINALSTQIGISPQQLSQMPTPSLRTILKESIYKDFSHGNTINLQGWVLSKSEVQACVIVALHEDEQ